MEVDEERQDLGRVYCLLCMAPVEREKGGRERCFWEGDWSCGWLVNGEGRVVIRRYQRRQNIGRVETDCRIDGW